MTNKEKALEIATDNIGYEQGYINLARYSGAMEMAQWKDKQYLNANFILEVLRINSNISDRSSPHEIAEQIVKELKKAKL